MKNKIELWLIKDMKNNQRKISNIVHIQEIIIMCPFLRQLGEFEDMVELFRKFYVSYNGRRILEAYKY